MAFGREGCQQRAMLEYAKAETAQGHGRQGRVQRTDKIFVEPLRFLNLETDPGYGGEVFFGKIDNEADAQIVQPWRCG
jgi:hypothetical protein